MERILLKFEKVLTSFAVFSVFVMMCLTTADAIGRYLFNFPITGAYEITEKYLMISAVYLGASYTYRTGSNIRVGILINHLPKIVQIVLNIFAQIVSICYGILLVIPTIQHLFKTYIQKTTLSSVNIPLWPPYVTIPLGLLIMSLLMIRDLPRVHIGKSALFKEESPIESAKQDQVI